MKCPVCQSQMSEKNLGQSKVYFCEHVCKGLLLGWKELTKLSKNNNQLIDMLFEAQNSSRQNESGRKPLICPSCKIRMHQHIFDSTNVNVDECYSCGYFFLDSGELSAIRKSYNKRKNKVLKQEYESKLIKNNPIFMQMRSEQERSKIRNNAIKSLSRLLIRRLPGTRSIFKSRILNILPGDNYSKSNYGYVKNMTDRKFKTYLKEVRHSRRVKLIIGIIFTGIGIFRIIFFLAQTGYFRR